MVRVGGRSGIGGRVTDGKPGFLDGRSQGKNGPVHAVRHFMIIFY